MSRKVPLHKDEGAFRYQSHLLTRSRKILFSILGPSIVFLPQNTPAPPHMHLLVGLSLSRHRSNSFLSGEYTTILDRVLVDGIGAYTGSRASRHYGDGWRLFGAASGRAPDWDDDRRLHRKLVADTGLV